MLKIEIRYLDNEKRVIIGEDVVATGVENATFAHHADALKWVLHNYKKYEILKVITEED